MLLQDRPAEGADQRYSVFGQCDLSHAKIESSDLTGCGFVGVRLFRAEFRNITGAESCRFEQVDIGEQPGAVLVSGDEARARLLSLR